jgi:transmembrane sensor
MSDLERDPMSHDDRLWLLLDRYLAGESTTAEADEVRAWLAADPAHKVMLESGRQVRDLASARPPTRSAEEAWHRATVELGLGPAGTTDSRVSIPVMRPFKAAIASQRRGRFGRTALVAAAAIVLVLGATLWRAEHSRRPPPSDPQVTFSSYTTQRGQRLSLRLSDGTRVVLAPGTVLRKPSTYGVRMRELELDGEAYFEVVHDSTRPMLVRTRQAVARDLGTRFVVRAYAGAGATEIVVAEGKVAVDTLVLERGQGARIPGDGKVHFTRDVALDRYFAWTEGRLVFRDTPLAKVAEELARWYDIEVRLADARLGDRRLTASFGEVPVTEVFDRIAEPLAVEIERAGRVYTIRAP